MTEQNKPHIPVMQQEALTAFKGVSLTVFFEGTLGAGGHAKLFLEAHEEIETYIGCDADPQALKLSGKNLEKWREKILFVQGNFRDLAAILKEKRIKKVDGFFLTSVFPRCSLMREKEGLVF
jgi:16S rRNA (cytosine1402-N4)-methyltransferase